MLPANKWPDWRHYFLFQNCMLVMCSCISGISGGADWLHSTSPYLCASFVEMVFAEPPSARGLLLLLGSVWRILLDRAIFLGSAVSALLRPHESTQVTHCPDPLSQCSLQFPASEVPFRLSAGSFFLRCCSVLVRDAVQL